MKEIYVISDKTTGRIKGSNKINREWDSNNLDGSTVTEMVERILTKNPEYEVVYLPSQPFPDKMKKKISSGEIVPLSVSDIASDQAIEDEQVAIKVELEAKLHQISGKTHVSLDSYLDENGVTDQPLRMLFHVVLALVHKLK